MKNKIKNQSERKKNVMNHSGDAAEQVVRLAMEGGEVILKLTGSAAKELGVFLVAALKNKNGKLKLKGRTRLNALLKSGKDVDVFSIRNSDLKAFAERAKKYGIVYAVVRDRNLNSAGMCDIMVKIDDAPRISTLVESLNIATVSRGRIESHQVMREKTDKTKGAEPDAPDKNDTEKQRNALSGSSEGKSEPEKTETEKPDVSKTMPVKEAERIPFVAGTENALPSEHFSETRANDKKGSPTSKKPSVREKLREIAATQKANENKAQNREEPAAKSKGTQKTTAHTQPPRKPKVRTER
jgi:hypothetical protein